MRILNAVGGVGLVTLACLPAWGGGVPGRPLEEVTVTATREGLLGQVDSASERTGPADAPDQRPLHRPGGRTTTPRKAIPGDPGDHRGGK